MDGMRKFTVLAALGWGLKGAAAGRWGDEAGRRQRLVGMHDPGGKRRHLFGVGEGPAEAVAGAKQDGLGETDHRWQVVGFRSGRGVLLLLSWMREALRPVLPALAITRRAPKCAPDMYVWSSVDLRLIYA